MDNKNKTRLSWPKRILIFFVSLILFPMELLLLLSIISSISDWIDHNRYIELDKQVAIIYDIVKKSASSSDKWEYKKECSGEFSGWLLSGSYFCGATIFLKKIVTTPKEVADAQARYYPVIDSIKTLKQKTDLSVSPSTYGKSFEVGSAEKHYVETNTNIECWYLNSLSQTTESMKTLNFTYGSEIDGGSGILRIELECSDKSRYYWYEPDERLKHEVDITNIKY